MMGKLTTLSTTYSISLTHAQSQENNSFIYINSSMLGEDQQRWK